MEKNTIDRKIILSSQDVEEKEGLVRRYVTQVKQAIQDFETTIKVEPDHIDARLHLASIHHSAERWKKAAPLWRQVLDIDSDNDVARQRLSQCEAQISIQSR